MSFNLIENEDAEVIDGEEEEVEEDEDSGTRAIMVALIPCKAQRELGFQCILYSIINSTYTVLHI